MLPLFGTLLLLMAPANDAVHFSLASGPECGGLAGVLGSGAVFGGNPASFVKFEVRLID